MKLTNFEALGAQQALSKLMTFDLPVKVSLDIALISNMVDERVRVFNIVRNSLFKKYSIKTSSDGTKGVIKFESTVEGNEQKKENLDAFMEKFNELLEAKTEDMIFKKIELPSDIVVKAEILKNLTEFIVIA